MRIITANIGHKNGVSLWRKNRAVQALCARRPDVLLLQETRNSGLLIPSGYGIRRAPDLAVLFRKEQPIAGWGAELVHPGRRNQWVERWLMWVELEELGAFVNIHVNSGIESGGRPRAGVDRDRLRFALKNIHRAKAHADRLPRTPRYVAGDMNVDASADARVRYPGFPAAELHRAGLVDLGPMLKGTLGSRTVDRVFGPEGTQAKADVVDMGAAFDHNAVEVRT